MHAAMSEEVPAAVSDAQDKIPTSLLDVSTDGFTELRWVSLSERPWLESRNAEEDIGDNPEPDTDVDTDNNADSGSASAHGLV